ncbi:hypothetical protein K8R66_02690 [bacterium]|nr:hypothetical protein [bacterium]
MKQTSIFLLVSIFSVFTQIANGQADYSELKVTIIKSLVQTDTYFTESSNVAYENICRIEFHNKAIQSYKEFETAYAQIKPNLSPEINEELVRVIKFYNQLAKKESFQYLSDGGTIIGLTIVSLRIEIIIGLMIK